MRRVNRVPLGAPAARKTLRIREVLLTLEGMMGTRACIVSIRTAPTSSISGRMRHTRRKRSHGPICRFAALRATVSTAIDSQWITGGRCSLIRRLTIPGQSSTSIRERVTWRRDSIGKGRLLPKGKGNCRAIAVSPSRGTFRSISKDLARGEPRDRTLPLR